MNLEGGESIKSVRLFLRGSKKCTFVDKGEGGVKNVCMYVRILWMPPNNYLKNRRVQAPCACRSLA